MIYRFSDRMWYSCGCGTRYITPAYIQRCRNIEHCLICERVNDWVIIQPYDIELINGTYLNLKETDDLQ